MENKEFNLDKIADKIVLKEEKEVIKKSFKKEAGIIITAIGGILFLFTVISSFFLNPGVKIALTSIRMGFSLSLLFIGISLIVKRRVNLWLGLLVVFFSYILLSYILCIDCYIGVKWSIFIHFKNAIMSGIDYIVYDTYRSIGEYYA